MSSACLSTSETLLIIKKGGYNLSMARGSIYTADLAAKERGIKMWEKRGEKQSTVWERHGAIMSTARYKIYIYSWKEG